MKAGPYSEELKQEIIQLNLEEKRSIKSLSLEYGMSTSTISRWIIIHRNTFAINKPDVKEGNDEQSV